MANRDYPGIIRDLFFFTLKDFELLDIVACASIERLPAPPDNPQGFIRDGVDLLPPSRHIVALFRVRSLAQHPFFNGAPSVWESEREEHNPQYLLAARWPGGTQKVRGANRNLATLAGLMGRRARQALALASWEAVADELVLLGSVGDDLFIGQEILNVKKDWDEAQVSESTAQEEIVARAQRKALHLHQRSAKAHQQGKTSTANDKATVSDGIRLANRGWK